MWRKRWIIYCITIMTGSIYSDKAKFIGKLAFWTAFFLELFYVFWAQSDLIPLWDGAFWRVTFGLTMVKVLTTRYSKKEWLVFAAAAVLGVISWRCSGKNEMLRILAWVYACKEVDPERIMKRFFYCTLGGSLVLILLSVTGIFGKVSIFARFRGGGYMETRYCLGMGHPNGLQCMILMITLMILYLYYEKLNGKWLFGLLLLNSGVFYLTVSRFGYISALFALLYTCGLKWSEKKGWRNAALIVSLMVYLSCIAVSLACAARTNIDPPFWWDLNTLTNGRVQAAFQQANLADWTLFGSGLYTEPVDMGFVRLFFWYGWIPALLACILGLYGLYWYIMVKNDPAAVLILSLAVYSVFESHIVSSILGRDPLIFLTGILMAAGFLNRGGAHCVPKRER